MLKYTSKFNKQGDSTYYIRPRSSGREWKSIVLLDAQKDVERHEVDIVYLSSFEYTLSISWLFFDVKSI